MWVIPLWVASGLVGEAVAAPLSAEDVVRSALERHPDAVAAHEAVDAAERRRSEVAVFVGDPEVEGGFSLVGDLLYVGATQPLSITGEGWYARRAARYGRDAAEADRHRMDLVVAAEARLAWADAVWAERRAALTADALELATGIRESVAARVETGDRSALDLALARAQEASAAALALEAGQARVEALAALSAYHPDAATDGVAGDPEDAVPTAIGTDATRSDIVAAEARTIAAQAALSRARAATMPPIGVGVSAERDDGSVDIGPMFRVAVPIWTRNRAEVGEASAAERVAVAELDAVRARAGAEVALGDELAGQASGVAGVLDGTDAAAADGLRMLAEAVTGGRLDLLDALVLQGELIDGRLAVIEAGRAAVAARIRSLLAHDDPALLGKEAP